MIDEKINIGIAGFGNIGSYFYKILSKNIKHISSKTGRIPYVKYISAKSNGKWDNNLGFLDGNPKNIVLKYHLLKY